MAIGRASGENRAVEAAQKAITNPLLDVTIDGAKGIIFNVTGGEDLRLHEVDEAAEIVRQMVDRDANIIFDAVIDPAMDDEIQITVIATGIDKEEPQGKRVRLRDVTPDEAHDPWTVRKNGENLDIPTFQRLGPEYNTTLHREGKLEQSKRSFFKRGFFKDTLDYPTFLRAKAD